MADLDDELLAMAGDESAGEQEDLGSDAGHSRSPSPAHARSPSPQHSPPRPSTEDKSTKSSSRRGVTQKSMAKTSSKRRKVDESEEEGEASSVPSSPQSLGSGAMDESDSDTSPGDFGDTLDEDNLYPLEGKFRDAKDKSEIMAMTQLEREEILAEREEEQARKKRDMQLRSLLESKDRETEKSLKKRKAGAADLDDAGRKTIRPRTKRGEALESYTRQREQAREEDRRRANIRTTGRRSRSRSSHSSQQDADGESEDEYGRSTIRVPEPEVQADLVDIQRIRVGRTNFAKVCFYPYFDATMTGCFARVCVGVNAYKMTQIKGVATGKPYLMDMPNNAFYTDQYVILAHGKAEKEWPFTHCSDSKFTEAELEDWKKTMQTESLRMITRKECSTKCEKINALINHRFTGDELNAKLDKQRKYRHLLNPSVSKPSIVKQTSSNDQQERLRLRNEKNRKQNTEDVRKALVEQKNRQRAAARAKAKADAVAKENSLAVPKSEFDSLFSEGSDLSRAATPVQEAKKNVPREKTKGGIPTFTKMSMDDDIIGTMDLGIDIEI